MTPGDSSARFPPKAIDQKPGLKVVTEQKGGGGVRAPDQRGAPSKSSEQKLGGLRGRVTNKQGGVTPGTLDHGGHIENSLVATEASQLSPGVLQVKGSPAATYIIDPEYRAATVQPSCPTGWIASPFRLAVGGCYDFMVSDMHVYVVHDFAEIL